MLALLLVVVGAAVSVLAFPPFGPGWLVIPGVALALGGLRLATGRRHGLLLGAVHGLVFYGGLIWWISELGLIAVIPLVVAQAVFLTVYGWWLGGHSAKAGRVWLALAVGGWAVMELLRYRLPVGGFEWGAVGYALSDQGWARSMASVIGTTGLTVAVVGVAAMAVVEVSRSLSWWSRVAVIAPLALAVALMAVPLGTGDHAPVEVAIVQGSTPCPFEHCPPDERLRTFEQHLALTKTIEPGTVDLVVWSEGSTGALNADPVQNAAVGEAIAAEARRIGAWLLVGSDRPVSDSEWVNANVVFDPEGEIVGEYQKQHPVPFGEYIPLRPFFTSWISELERVPRDMIPGEGPVLFDTGGYVLGSVISFEGGFSRYPREHARLGANVLVVATNEGSYGLTPASDQFIGMTRMRAAELGLPVIHAAVTGKSVIIGSGGELVTEKSGLATQEIIYGRLIPGEASLYARTGDVLMLAAAIAGLGVWWRTRRLVGSPGRRDEER
ncbi:MAG: apolipoprotein N-acyltransferase [Actinobacteria bacterium]|nr:apolipoprotein N-acyltransferase [Actinomycetota bacterium]